MWIRVCGGNTHRSYLTAVSSVGPNRVSCCFSGCWAVRKGLDVLKEETRLLRKGVNASFQALPCVVRACWGVNSLLTSLPAPPCPFPCTALALSLSMAQVTLEMQLNCVHYSTHFGAQSYLIYHVVALEGTSTKARKGGACLHAADRLETERNICTQSLNCLDTTGAAAPPRGPERPPQRTQGLSSGRLFSVIPHCPPSCVPSFLNPTLSP